MFSSIFGKKEKCPKCEGKKYITTKDKTGITTNICNKCKGKGYISTYTK